MPGGLQSCSAAAASGGDRHPEPFHPEAPSIGKIPLQGDALRVSVCTDNDMIDQDVDLFQQCLSQDDELISERLRALAALLREQGY